MILLFFVACGAPVDVYGGGTGLELSFGDILTRGFSGAVTVPGVPDKASLKLNPDEREGLTGSLESFGADPMIRFVTANGTESLGGLTEAEVPGDFRLSIYGDWLEDSTLTDIGFGGAKDYASVLIRGGDGDPLSFWGSWQTDQVEVTVDDLSGRLSGPMDFEEAVDDLAEPARWTQEVTVVWSFDPELHHVLREVNQRSGGMVPGGW